MNFKFLIVMCVIFVLIIPDADALWGRRRRRRRKPPVGHLCRKFGCGIKCGIRCTFVGGHRICKHYCHRVCGWHIVPCGKRDAPELDEATNDDDVTYDKDPTMHDEGENDPVVQNLEDQADSDDQDTP